MKDNTAFVFIMFIIIGGIIGGGYIDTQSKTKLEPAQQNFKSFKYIDWPEEIVEVSTNPNSPDILEVYRSKDGDSIFVKFSNND